MVAQPVEYPSQNALLDVTSQLGSLPGLVTPHEIISLRGQLRDVAQGKAFLLQAGDCAELFADCTPAKIEEKVKLQLLMSLIIIWGSRVPVVRIGRIAGQYAKPRSKPTEIVTSPVDGSTREVPSFRGDNVNGFSSDDRLPDPQRLLHAYFYSAATLNHIRASLASGLADLHAPLSWTTAHVRSPTLAARFQSIVASLTDALDFMRVVGAEQSQSVLRNLETVDYFSSHEGLMLEFEEALTRPYTRVTNGGYSSAGDSDSLAGHTLCSQDMPSKEFYALSAHTLWMGDRTRDPFGAHAEYFSGIANPIGIKIGPNTTPHQLLELLSKVDRSRGRDVGRITLICRFGRGKVGHSSSLPKNSIDLFNPVSLFLQRPRASWVNSYRPSSHHPGPRRSSGVATLCMVIRPRHPQTQRSRQGRSRTSSWSLKSSSRYIPHLGVA